MKDKKSRLVLESEEVYKIEEVYVETPVKISDYLKRIRNIEDKK
jgi:hypothetical protein